MKTILKSDGAVMFVTLVGNPYSKEIKLSFKLFSFSFVTVFVVRLSTIIVIIKMDQKLCIV